MVFLLLIGQSVSHTSLVQTVCKPVKPLLSYSTFGFKFHSPVATMNKLATPLLILSFLQLIAGSCVFNVCTDECPENAPTAGQCAILFDEPKCNDEKFVIADNGDREIRVSEVKIVKKQD